MSANIGQGETTRHSDGTWSSGDGPAVVDHLTPAGRAASLRAEIRNIETQLRDLQSRWSYLTGQLEQLEAEAS
jgi:hypothetical protein